ncbi:MAG: GerMN domain-containing protein [Fusobacteria bacterium]|nr:GerMN domain-containing protein [Fusobacteriota bacterium]
MGKKWNTILVVVLIVMIGYYVYYLVAQKNIGMDLLKHKKNVAMANISGVNGSQTSTINVTFYNPNSQGSALQPITSTVQIASGYQDYDLVKLIATTYIAQDSGWVDPSTQVLNVFVQNGTVYLNLSSGFTSKMDTSDHAQLIINGIVNSIIQNDTNISQVALLINGQVSSVISKFTNNQQFFTSDLTSVSGSSN